MTDINTDVFQAHRIRRAAARRKNSLEVIERKAVAIAKANPSDPFAYATAKSEMLNGLSDTLDDWNVEFTAETRTIQHNGKELTFQVQVPINQSHP